MAKKKADDPLSFDFGANVAPKKPRSRSAGKKPRSAAQRAAAQYYATRNRRRR
jgi:hypothetical protein